MPCNCEYMNPNDLEVQISRVACLLGELDGVPWRSRDWAGYHPDVYGQASRVLGDALTARLCSALQKAEVSKYSLEMQIWWRDHQLADKKRVQRELAAAKREEDRKALVESLSDYERKLLGV